MFRVQGLGRPIRKNIPKANQASLKLLEGVVVMGLLRQVQAVPHEKSSRSNERRSSQAADGTPEPVHQQHQWVDDVPQGDRHKNLSFFCQSLEIAKVMLMPAQFLPLTKPPWNLMDSIDSTRPGEERRAPSCRCQTAKPLPDPGVQPSRRSGLWKQPQRLRR